MRRTGIKHFMLFLVAIALSPIQADDIVSRGDQNHRTINDVIIQHYTPAALEYWEQRNGFLQKNTLYDPDTYYDVVFQKEKTDQIKEQWRRNGISLEVTYARNGETEAGLHNCYVDYNVPSGSIKFIQHFEFGSGAAPHSVSLTFGQHKTIRLREIDKMDVLGNGAYSVFPKGNPEPFSDTIRLPSLPVRDTQQTIELFPVFRCYTYETSGQVSRDKVASEPRPFFDNWEIEFAIIRSVKFISEGLVAR